MRHVIRSHQTVFRGKNAEPLIAQTEHGQSSASSALERQRLLFWAQEMIENQVSLRSNFCLTDREKQTQNVSVLGCFAFFPWCSRQRTRSLSTPPYRFCSSQAGVRVLRAVPVFWSSLDLDGTSDRELLSCVPCLVPLSRA